MIPQRPGIGDFYREVRHEFAEHHATGKERFVADTSDEESNLPDDPLDLDEEMMVPQKTIVKEIYKDLPHHRHSPSSSSPSKPTTTVSSGTEGVSSSSHAQHGTSSASGLGPPDPNSSSVASLNSEDIELADELASMVSF